MYTLDNNSTNERTFLSLTSNSPIYLRDITKKRNVGCCSNRLYFWLSRVRSFWITYPVLGFLLDSLPVFLLITTIFMAVYYPDGYQEKVALPIALCVVLVCLMEMIPFSPMPTFTSNSITNRDGPYRGAFRASVNASVFAILIILIISVLQLVSVNSEDGITTEWSWMQSNILTTMIPSVLILVIPMVYITYSVVNILYRESPIFRPLDPRVYAEKELPIF